MLAYNGSIPGPTFRVQQGSELVVHVVNEGDLDATVHWHGLRLDNRYDGTAEPFNRSKSTYTAMGRFGNVLLVNGEPEPLLTARKGEVLRLYLTNTANTRVFNVALPGARMKLVGSDSGRYEREQLVENVVIAPSERAVVDVLFSTPGQLTLEHHTPHRTYSLAAITVTDEPAQPSLATQFGSLRTNSDLVSEREHVAPYLSAEPNKTLAFVAEMDMGRPGAAPWWYGCVRLSHPPGGDRR
jgi:FtsP/CotA-like multicopper oxidase with cupredoxin domain